jgi:hypothetical protein
MVSVAQRMRAEFNETASMKHRGGKGAAREDIVRDFMTRYLPGQVEVTGRGEIITTDEQVSPECDIMVVDRNAPPFTDRRSFRIVPAECVHGIVEVKSRLDGRELRDACEKIKAVKSLPKTAYAPPPPGSEPLRALFYGLPYNYTPTAGLIFAFDSISLEELAEQFADWSSRKDIALIPDGVWVLDKGHLLWSAANGNLLPRPDPQSDIAVVQADADRSNLLYLAIQLGILFSYAWMPPLSLQQYAGIASGGTEIKRYGPRRP